MLPALLIEKWVGKTNDIDLSALKSTKVLAVIIPVCIIYAFITIERNSEWSDDYTLYKSDVIKAPENARLNFYLGTELEDKIAPQEKDPAKHKQLLEDAITYLKKAIQIYPGYDLAEWNLGQTYFLNLQYDSAEVHDLRALQLIPGNPNVLYNLSTLYFVQKKYPQSIECSRKLIELDPKNIFTYGNIGLAYLNAGKYDSAIYYSNLAILIDPRFNGSYEILASVYKAIGNSDSSGKYLAIAQRNNPGFQINK